MENQFLNLANSMITSPNQLEACPDQMRTHPCNCVQMQSSAPAAFQRILMNEVNNMEPKLPFDYFPPNYQHNIHTRCLRAACPNNIVHYAYGQEYFACQLKGCFYCHRNYTYNHPPTHCACVNAYNFSHGQLNNIQQPFLQYQTYNYDPQCLTFPNHEQSTPNKIEHTDNNDNNTGNLESKQDERMEKKYKCNYFDCGKSYAKLCHLRAHYRVHTGERPLVCVFPYPREVFSRLPTDELTRHLRKHLNIRPFKCHICSKSFSRSDHCKTHLRIHLRKRCKANANSCHNSLTEAPGTHGEELSGNSSYPISTEEMDIKFLNPLPSSSSSSHVPVTADYTRSFTTTPYSLSAISSPAPSYS
ncbi:unnamed protein product [Heterobilharzia americana]|nr:unnamed protein product [Heterobilharzia americana]